MNATWMHRALPMVCALIHQEVTRALALLDLRKMIPTCALISMSARKRPPCVMSMQPVQTLLVATNATATTAMAVTEPFARKLMMAVTILG